MISDQVQEESQVSKDAKRDSGAASTMPPEELTNETSASSGVEKAPATGQLSSMMGSHLVRLMEKSIIIHKDENGFGLRIKGQSPVFIEHVHENGAAWRAGVRALDTLCKVNGVLVGQMDHKEVVLLFKSCSRFVALTLMTPALVLGGGESPQSTLVRDERREPASGSSYSQRVYQFLGRADVAPGTLAGHIANRRLSGAAAAAADPAVPSTFMDRTNSCRSTASLVAYHQGSKMVGVIKPAQHQTKLSRQDSVETADKRLAVCICCRNSIEGANTSDEQSTMPITCHQCRLRYRTSHELSYRHPGSLREPPPGSVATRFARGPPAPAPPPPPTAPAPGNKQVQTPERQKNERNCQFNSSASIKSLPVKPTNKAGHQQSGLLATKMAPVVVAENKPPQINKRVEIIREFIDTERTHTERLRCLNELFYRPLKESGFVSAEQLRAVFSSHRTLYKIHKQVYRILVSSAHYDVYSEPLVGSALVEIFEGDLKRRLERASCSFCSAQATNTELLNKLTRRDTKAGELLAQITSQRMVGRLGIKDLLASCFQRLTKYPLLLGNLLKATPQSLPQDDEDADLALGPGGPHRRRSKSGLSAHQRRARLRAGMSDDAGATEEDEEEDDEEDEYEDEEEEDGVTEEDDEEAETDEDEEARQARLGAAEEARRNSRRIMAISLAEEREFIERALVQSRAILVRVNESIRVAIARQRLKEIWKRTDKYPGVPLIDITKQQVVHEGSLTLRLSKRSFDVYVLLLNNYIIILTREGQDKYRLKFFTPEGKSVASSLVSSASNSASVSSFMSSASGGGGGGGGTTNAGNGNGNGNNPTINNGSSTNVGNHHLAMSSPHQTVYSPVFVIDEHLTTRDAATDENGFYLLCKRKDDSRIYEFASRSPAERMKWRDKIQWTIERQIGRTQRRPSCESTLTKSSSEISANGGVGAIVTAVGQRNAAAEATPTKQPTSQKSAAGSKQDRAKKTGSSRPPTPSSSEPTKIVGTISYVIDDGIVLPSKMESSRVFVDQAIQVNILDGSSSSSSSSATTTTVGKAIQQTTAANAQ